MGYEGPRTGAQRVAKRRAALRAQGLRPRTFWLPDASSDAFKRQAESDVAWLWANIDRDEEMMTFAEAMSEQVLADAPIPRWREAG